MSNISITYALITSLFENGEDYLDCFWPLAIQALYNKPASGLDTLQSDLRASSNLEIPINVLKTLMHRCIKKGYVDKVATSFKLNNKGIQYVANLQTPREVERQINALIDAAYNFFAQNAVPLSHDDLHKLFLNFVSRNITPLTDFLNSREPLTAFNSGNSTKHEMLLVKYLELIEKQKPDFFQTFAKMLLGSILSSILYTDDPLKTQDIIYRRFQRCELYLDTNFLLGVLGLDHPQFNTAAQELIGLIKKHKCPLKVFDFTVGEVCTVINEYTTDSGKYTSSVRVNSISSSLKIMGWTKAKAVKYIADIDEILRQEGISITTTNIILKNYAPSSVQHRQIMSTYKPHASQTVLNHDLAAIEKIRQTRKSSVWKIENANAIFLSSDAALSKFDFKELGHQQNKTVPEVIIDRLLTNILWLKDPHIKLSLSSVIATHSGNLFVNRRVWNKFHDVLADLSKDGKTTDSDITALFYHGFIETVLTDLGEDDLNSIDTDFALDQIEKAKEKIDQEREQAVGQAKIEILKQVSDKKDAEFLKFLKEERRIQEENNQRTWLSKLQEVRANLRSASSKSARKRTRGARAITSVALIAVPTIFFFQTRSLDTLRTVLAIIGFLGLVITYGVGDLNKLWASMETRLANDLYRKKIDEAGIEKKIPQ